MAIVTIYGVKGVGKDTVAQRLHDRNPTLILSSESRVMMYVLGIARDFRSEFTPSRDQYKTLEDVLQAGEFNLEDKRYEAFIGELAAAKNDVLITSHLVYLLHLGQETSYRTDIETPEWYIKTGRAFIQLVAPSSAILQRRLVDYDLRQRPVSGIEEIEHHQSLCDVKWERLTRLAPPRTPCVIIENVDLVIAVEQAEKVLYDRT